MRGSVFRASGASASDRSPGPILDAQPAQRANCVRRKISARVCDMSTPAACWFLSAAGARLTNRCDGIDFYEHAAWKARNLNGRSRRTRVTDHAAVDLVHTWEVGHVLQVDRRLDDVRPARTRILEHRGQVAHHALGLRGDVALDDLASGGIDRDLAGGEQQVAGDDALRVRADGRGSLVSVYDASAHVIS